MGQFAFLADKVCTTFLDEVEGLGFAKDMTHAEKRAAVAEYAKQTRAFMQREGIRKPELTLLDYRIVFFFLRRPADRYDHADDPAQGNGCGNSQTKKRCVRE